jgi:hypothetical protein
MKMDRKYVIRRRVVMAVIIITLSALFTYTTRDTCYVGTNNDYGNFLGYGSCEKMLDEAVNG